MATKKTENTNSINFAQFVFYENSPVDMDSEDTKLAAIIEKASPKERESGAYVLKQMKYLMEKGGVFDAHLSFNNPPQNTSETKLMYTLIDTANDGGANSPKEDKNNE